MEEKHFDVIICGAGPSGSTCALALADSGLKVAVIEKNSFPRAKVCGDANAAYVPKVHNTINPKYREAALNFLEKVPVNTCRLILPNGKHIDVEGTEYYIHHSSNRKALIGKKDNFLPKMLKLSSVEPS